MTTNNTPIDEKWFERLWPIFGKIGETYEALMPPPSSLEQERALFESSGFTRNCSLFPERSVASAVEAASVELMSLRSTIVAHEPNVFVRRAYIDYADGLLTHARMIIAAAHHDAINFEKENVALYGAPDKHVYEAACSWIRYTASSLPGGASSHLHHLAEKVLQLVPANDGDFKLLIPSETTFQKVRNMHRQPGGYYSHLFGVEGLPHQAYVTQAEGDAICQRVLSNIGSDYTIESSTGNLWSTSREHKQLLRPTGYRIENDEFIGIVSHEIGTHTIEVANGSRQRLRLLEIGLADYEKSSEGRAFLREQIVYENATMFLTQFSWEYIVLLHFGVCLAVGYDSKPYSFSELYETLFTLYAFWREKRYPHGPDNEVFAREEAWHLTIRVMKSTDGNGGAHRKDIIYLEGNINCWRLADVDPAIILRGDIGKFAITSNAHMDILHGLKIL